MTRSDVIECWRWTVGLEGRSPFWRGVRWWISSAALAVLVLLAAVSMLAVFPVL